MLLERRLVDPGHVPDGDEGDLRDRPGVDQRQERDRGVGVRRLGGVPALARRLDRAMEKQASGRHDQLLEDRGRDRPRSGT